MSKITYLKRQAKKLKKELNITHGQALETLAKNEGFKNWDTLQRHYKENSIGNC